MATREDVVRTARSMIGTRWRHQGRTPGKQLDCVGLVVKVAHQLGLSDYDFTGYTRESHWNEFVHHFAQNMDEVKPRRPYKPADVLIFRQGRYPCHCGIASMLNGKLSLIHALVVPGETIEEYIEADPELTTLHIATFRFRGLED